MDFLIRLALWSIAWLVPAAARERWLEEWRAEIAHSRRSMILGALPDAWTLRTLSRRDTPRRRGGPWHTDAKQTLRSLAGSPWHVITVTFCLGIGISVTVTVFSILAAILSGDLPGIHDRAALKRLYLITDESWGRSGPANASLSDYEILRQGSPALPAVAAEGRWLFALRTPAGPTAVEGAFVSGNYFDVLGTRPAAGRLLTPDDDRTGAAPAAVLSHAFWRAQFGAAAGVVGSTIVVAGRDVHVVGIAPEHFSGTDVGDLGEPPGLRFKLYLPLSLAGTFARTLSRHERWLAVLGRAAGSRTRETLAAELQPLAAAIEAENPESRRNTSVLVTNSGMGPSDTPAVVAAIVALLMAGPLTVLAIGCANVANLQLVRASRRERELSVRLAIGASRAQLVRLLALESAFLSVAACAAGALGTWVLLRIARLVIPFRISIDWPVLAFVVATGIGVVVATGILPAWLATRPGASPTAAGRSAAPGPSRARSALAIAQIALSLVLLLAAALFTRSLGSLAGRVPPLADEVIAAELRFDTLGYSEPRRAAFVEELRARLRSDARVQAVGFNTVRPLRRGSRRFWLPDDSAQRFRSADGGEVTLDWFEAAGLQLLSGRTFTRTDLHSETAIVDRAFVDKYGLSEPVPGTELRVERSLPARPDIISLNRPEEQATTVTIVGVVSNGLTRPIVSQPLPSLYVPLRSIPDYLVIYVRTPHPREIQQQLRSTLAAIDPDLPAIEIATLADRFDRDAGDIRLLAQAASGLGLAAVVLAVAGVYSVLAFFASLRTHEFGVRLAVGARPADIVALVVRQAGRLVGAGLAVGMAFGVPVLIFLNKAFPYTNAFDPAGLLAPAALLAASALLAACVPARNAARVDPCAALRAE